MKAIFPGTFDPFTTGHLSILNRAMLLFDKVYVALGTNSEKKSMFSLQQRIVWIKELFAYSSKIEVITYDTLTVSVAKQYGAHYLIRGLRTAVDFEYERQIGLINKTLEPQIETIYLLTLPEHTHISSSMVREVIKYRGNIENLVPEIIANEIQKIMNYELKN